MPNPDLKTAAHPHVCSHHPGQVTLQWPWPHSKSWPPGGPRRSCRGPLPHRPCCTGCTQLSPLGGPKPYTCSVSLLYFPQGGCDTLLNSPVHPVSCRCPASHVPCSPLCPRQCLACTSVVVRTLSLATCTHEGGALRTRSPLLAPAAPYLSWQLHTGPVSPTPGCPMSSYHPAQPGVGDWEEKAEPRFHEVEGGRREALAAQHRPGLEAMDPDRWTGQAGAGGRVKDGEGAWRCQPGSKKPRQKQGRSQAEPPRRPG